MSKRKKTIKQQIQERADKEGISFHEASKKFVLRIGRYEMRPESAFKNQSAPGQS